MGPQVDTPVLIVGGGIVGLTASLCLSYHGIHHLLVERHVGTSIHPRARGYNIRAMEILRELGVDQLVRDAGAELSSSKGIYQGSSLAEVIEPKKRSTAHSTGGLPFSKEARRFSPTVGAWATQDCVEPVLLKVARESSFADMRFYTECTDLAQSPSEVMAKLRNRDTEEITPVRAQYVIAADGAKSPIRQKLGVETTGKGRLGSLINILFEADLHELVRGREFSLCLVDRPEVRGLFASLNNRDRWVFQLAYKPEKGERAEDFPLERCRELVQLALGMPKVEVKITAALPWEPSVRVATTLREGRVFFAGDAAHQMPPWRGQGATTGISDAHNLTWKLAAVLNGQATSALLDTYTSERLPVGHAAANMSGEAAGEDGLIEWNWSIMLKILFSLPWMTGLGYNYDSAAILRDEDSPYFAIPWYPTAWVLDLQGRPGTRVPHLAVQRDGQEISTLDVCTKSFTILSGQENVESWRQAAAGLQASMGVELKVHSVGPEGDLRDANNHWLYLARIASSGALLVRPDGFVAWRAYSRPADPAKRLEQVMKQVLCR